MSTALFVLEIIGAVSFAISGALVSIKSKLDLFGVMLLGCITAYGGGIIRDLIIGQFPPAVFSRSYMVLITAAVSVIVFVISYINRHKFNDLKRRIEHINNFFDALGLAAFTVMGTEIAFATGFQDKVFLSITLGLLTGVGGGIIRDVLVSDTPYILKKHVYALVSIVGAGMYYVLRLYLPNSIITIAAPVVVIVVMRMLAARFRWELPKIHIEDEE